MTDRKKVIGLLQEAAEYFRECRSNVSFASKEENHFWELQNAMNEAIEVLKDRDSEIVRCKDCKRKDTLSCPKAPKRPDDWFCADGKRRETNE